MGIIVAGYILSILNTSFQSVKVDFIMQLILQMLDIYYIPLAFTGALTSVGRNIRGK
jgi:hypothetical protein